MIIKEGQAAVCRDDLAARKIEKRHMRNNTEEFKTCEQFLKNPSVFRKQDNERVYQNKKIYIDDNNSRVP